MYDKLKHLPIKIESYTLEPLELVLPNGWTRKTTVIHLKGGGEEGIGEDITYDADNQVAFQKAGPILHLAGSHTFEDFSGKLAGVDLFPDGLKEGYGAARQYRQWAFESAALDLALRQAKRSLAEALGRTPRPVTFVASLGLGEPSTFEPVEQRLSQYPDMRFKLDAKEDWTDKLIARLAATNAIDTVDLKGHYVGLSVNTEPDPVLYRRIVEGFPKALIEDPAVTPKTRSVLEPHADRITWDAPLHKAADIAAMDFVPKVINIKPSRFGSLEELCATYDYCESHDISMYGGGQFELGPGRGQIEYLAALFHPDTANDVAPVQYHASVVEDGWPTSPLQPQPVKIGFRWEA